MASLKSTGRCGCVPGGGASAPARRLACCLGLVIVWLATASNARAGCGDYVHVQARSVTNDPSHINEVPDNAQTDQILGGASPKSDEHPLPPCRGPNCSRQPVLPTQGVPQVTSFPSQQWACCLLAVDAHNFDETAVRGEAPLVISAGHPSYLERPPRDLG
jgi:hypothetical protein